MKAKILEQRVLTAANDLWIGCICLPVSFNFQSLKDFFFHLTPTYVLPSIVLCCIFESKFFSGAKSVLEIESFGIKELFSSFSFLIGSEQLKMLAGAARLIS